MAAVLKHFAVIVLVVVHLAVWCSATGNNTTVAPTTTASNGTQSNITSTVAPTTGNPTGTANGMASSVFIAIGSLMISVAMKVLTE